MKKVLAILTILGGSVAVSGCTLFEDGSAVLDDGTGICLFGDWGCGDGGTPSLFPGDPVVPSTLEVPELVVD